MDLHTQMLFCLLIWIPLIYCVLAHGIFSKHGTAGLPLAYTLNMAIMHCGAVLYLKSDYNHRQNPYLRSYNFSEETVFIGLFATTIGMIAFLLGNLFGDFTVTKPKERPTIQWPVRRVVLGLLAIAVGSFIASKILPALPSIQSVLGAGRNAALCGCAIGFAVSVGKNDFRRSAMFLAFSLFVPAFYLLAFGFVSFGIIFVVTFLSFCIFRFRLTFARVVLGTLPALVIVYIGLSVFVGYMQNRSELRKVLWSNKGLGERVGAVQVVWDRIGFFDPEDQSHLFFIDQRLNHNILVGKAIETLERNPNMFANGETVISAVLAWVPRFLWPNKPVNGGAAFVTRFTGQRFDKSTTMQSGQVFEFFVNFGWIGLGIGMFFLGAVIRGIDVRCNMALKRHNWVAFGKLQLVGIAFILPSGQLFFLVSSAAASIVLGYVLEQLLRSNFLGSHFGTNRPISQLGTG